MKNLIVACFLALLAPTMGCAIRSFEESQADFGDDFDDEPTQVWRSRAR